LQPWLCKGQHFDWRKVQQLLKAIILPSEIISCTACCNSCEIFSEVFVESNPEQLFCHSCFISREFWNDEDEKKKAIEKVIMILEMMADNDDISITRTHLRKFLFLRWPNNCASHGQAGLWIETTIEAGEATETKLPSKIKYSLFLSITNGCR